MAIFSQSRSDLYNHAFEQPRDAPADLSTTPQHIISMIYQRTTSAYPLTCGDVVDALAPTFDEARTLGVLRATTLQLALDMFDEKKTLIHKRSIAPEVVDFMFDKLPPDQVMDFYNLWDVIEALRPTTTEAKEAGQRVETLRSEWQSFLDSLDPPVSEDGSKWDDFDF